MKRTRLSLLVVLFLTLARTGQVWAQSEPPPELQIPGRVEGTGTCFEITDSEYLNITLTSSQPISLVLASVPEMVTMEIESASGATSAEVTLEGFAPGTTYYKYEDDYHNEVAFTTDGGGAYAYVQDLSGPHHVFIQPRASTLFIKDDATGGDATSIGTWDWATKTCTLTTDVYETIQIDSDDITLDGSGHTITGTDTGYGVYAFGKTGVTIKNLNVDHFHIGIWLIYSNGNTLTGNTANSNKTSGIYLYGGGGNTLAGNTANMNHTMAGIGLNFSSSNALTGNTADLNNYGIQVAKESYGNTLKGNSVSNNNIGIDIYYYASSNVLTGNTVSNNNMGIYLSQGSSSNKIYNNNFMSNATQVRDSSYWGGPNVYNLAAPVGGNYWSNWTSPDLNGDGFVDNPYVIRGAIADYLPWTTQDGWLPPNDPPVAEAGPPQVIEATGSTTSFTLDGSASWDPDEDPLSYSWVDGDGDEVGTAATVTLARVLGSYTFTLTVTDLPGLSSSDSVSITIQDTTPPTLTLPADMVVEATSSAGAVVEFDVTASDLAGGPLLITSTPGSGCVFPLGANTVACTASDAAGNTAAGSFTVTVQDTTPPTITPPADVEVSESDPLGTPVDLGQPTVSDACDPNPTVQNDAPALFPLDETTVTWTTMDASGNVATAQQKVTVVPGSAENQVCNLDKLIDYGVALGAIAPELQSSLLPKVDAAMAALARDNPNDAKAAMGELRALVNQVEAQTDKKIEPATAAQMIARASQVIAALGA